MARKNKGKLECKFKVCNQETPITNRRSRKFTYVQSEENSVQKSSPTTASTPKATNTTPAATNGQPQVEAPAADTQATTTRTTTTGQNEGQINEAATFDHDNNANGPEAAAPQAAPAPAPAPVYVPISAPSPALSTATAPLPYHDIIIDTFPCDARWAFDGEHHFCPRQGQRVLPPYLILVKEGDDLKLRMSKRYTLNALPLIYQSLVQRSLFSQSFYISGGVPRKDEFPNFVLHFAPSGCAGQSSLVYKNYYGVVCYAHPDDHPTQDNAELPYHNDIDFSWTLNQLRSGPLASVPSNDAPNAQAAAGTTTASQPPANTQAVPVAVATSQVSAVQPQVSSSSTADQRERKRKRVDSDEESLPPKVVMQPRSNGKKASDELGPEATPSIDAIDTVDAAGVEATGEASGPHARTPSAPLPSEESGSEDKGEGADRGSSTNPPALDEGKEVDRPSSVDKEKDVDGPPSAQAVAQKEGTSPASTPASNADASPTFGPMDIPDITDLDLRIDEKTADSDGDSEGNISFYVVDLKTVYPASNFPHTSSDATSSSSSSPGSMYDHQLIDIHDKADEELEEEGEEMITH
ncbi:hypothetical protein BDY19DRAFT_996313 [Irpex rosettiformis]|uniref:Uncharacterized protein n=1 Tax=Irpex rosettiformis TaxID=378272 RepID=A0ACB8TUX6_9APHY|nr:hypothetical protein BDY19DRAFT_996313 [Irpex rosettiformis]